MMRIVLITMVSSAVALGCGSATSRPSNNPSPTEEQLAQRIADEVYERLRREGRLECSCAQDLQAQGGRAGR